MIDTHGRAPKSHTEIICRTRDVRRINRFNDFESVASQFWFFSDTQEKFRILKLFEV